jgi:hypothetical protein
MLKDRFLSSSIERVPSSFRHSRPVLPTADATPFCTCFLCEAPLPRASCETATHLSPCIYSQAVFLQRDYLKFSDGDAESFSNAFLTVVALSGIAGAIYSDIYAGAFKVQWQASIIWTIGAAMLFYLTLNEFSQGEKLVVAAVAWALLAFGLGSMMPSQAAFVGQQLVDPDPVKSVFSQRSQSFPILLVSQALYLLRRLLHRVQLGQLRWRIRFARPARLLNILRHLQHSHSSRPCNHVRAAVNSSCALPLTVSLPVSPSRLAALTAVSKRRCQVKFPERCL